MSHQPPDPEGGSRPQLVAFVRLSADHTYSYQCAVTCTYSCIGDDKCKGVKIPILAPGASVPPPFGMSHSSTSIPSSSSLPRPITSVAVVPPIVPTQPVPEINQLLLRTSTSLDPTSPTTQQYLKGNIG